MNTIKSFLKKFPLIYNYVQKIYYSCWQVLETHILGTRLQEWIWKTRHIYKGIGWVNGYCSCESINHSHRLFLVERIYSCAPFRSILEIGCNSGPNLYLLAKKLANDKSVKVYGIDINPQAIKEGKRWLEQIGISNVQLSVGKADELRQFHDKSIDIAFTDATLLYIGPDKIEKVIKEMRRITCKVLVFNEWHWENNSQKEKEYFWYDGHWVYNYKTLLKNYFPYNDIDISKHPKDLWGGTTGWAEFGAIIEVKL